MTRVASNGKRPALLILADDLTGAADSAAACCKAGLDAVTLLDAAAPLPIADVLAIDTDTRQKTDEEAAATIEQLFERLRADAPLVYKKIDSTLRGPFAAEIGTMLAALKRRSGSPATALLAPAFPRTGRTTVSGRQRLGGLPLEETEAWRREQKGETAFLPDRMAAEGLTAALVPLQPVRAGEEALLSALSASSSAADVVVCDAETEDDLRAIARASLRLDCPVVWAGSAGLAGHLAAALAPAPFPHENKPPCLHGAVLFVVGSPSAISQRQADLLAASGIAAIDIDRHAAARPAFAPDAAARAEAALAEGKDVLLRLKSDTFPAADMLAALAASSVGRAGALFVTGGETARGILVRLNIPGLRLLGELEPGVAFSVTLDARALPVVTKAGAFGTETTMLDCRRRLDALRARSAAQQPQPGR